MHGTRISLPFAFKVIQAATMAFDVFFDVLVLRDDDETVSE